MKNLILYGVAGWLLWQYVLKPKDQVVVIDDRTLPENPDYIPYSGSSDLLANSSTNTNGRSI